MSLASRIALPLLAIALLIPGASFAAPTSANSSSSLAVRPQRDLMLGARGTDVTELQEKIIVADSGIAAKALAQAGPTGYFGKLTRAAVIEFQKARGIAPAYGYFGTKTRAALWAGNPLPGPTFSGALEAVNTACFADGVCSVTVDGKKVIVLAGMRMDVPPVGKIIGAASVGDLEQHIGATVRVYAATTTEAGYDYTLYGSTKYYVQILVAPAGEPVTVRGTMTCLPPKDPSKPTIALCAFGLKTADGIYYGLKQESGSGYSDFWSEGTYEVTGTLTKDSVASIWNSAGTIAITKITKVS